MNVILVGDTGRSSMLGVFAQMPKNPDNFLFMRRRPRLGSAFFRKYSDSENFTKVKTAELKNSIVIRYGTRLEANVSGSIVYNESQAIAKASNKLAAREIFIREGVSTVPLIKKEPSSNKFNISNIDPSYFPIIARPFTHSKGKDFVVLNTIEELNNHYEKYGYLKEWYYSGYIKKTAEFRVHAAHGKILSVMAKPIPEDPNQLAWNRALNEESFLPVPWTEWNYEVCVQGLNAVKALGLDFAGVDVIFKDGVAYVLEVNTSPSLNTSPYMTTKYAQYFNWLFASPTKREHFDYTAFKKVDSISWKNFNFEDREPLKKQK